MLWGALSAGALVNLSSVSSFFELACLGRTQNLAVGKPVSVRQAVSAFSSFSEGQSPYSRQVGGRFSTNGEFHFKTTERLWGKLTRTSGCYKSKYFLCSTCTAVSGKSKFCRTHNLNCCTWFTVNFGEFCQVVVVTKKTQKTRTQEDVGKRD